MEATAIDTDILFSSGHACYGNVLPCLRIGSYNCRGFNSRFKKDYITGLLNDCDIFCLQEHWLSSKQLSDLSSIHDGFVYAAVSGFGDSEVLAGRPYGGCAILWRANVNMQSDLVETHSTRLCAVRFESASWKLLIVNVYMPCEGSSSEEFCEQLACIEGIISQYQDCHIVLCGDFNVDFCRVRPHTDMLNEFCIKLDLCASARHAKNEIDYTYNFAMKRFNSLDHFIMSSALFDSAVDDILVQHDIENLSDHDPIFIRFSLSSNLFTMSNKIYHEKVAWHKCTDADFIAYSNILSALLKDVHLPVDAIQCRNPLCVNNEHIICIHKYANDLTEACLTAAESALPKTTFNHSKRKPGWNEFVRPAREKSLFWHNIWTNAGRPKTGILADIMRRTRAAYHYAIRRIKREEANIVKERFAATITSDQNRDFWTEVRKIANKTAGTSATVDGISEPDRIAELFANKYQSLYSSVIQYF